MLALLFAITTSSCTTIPETPKQMGAPVTLPFLRLESQECYYIDEFLPTPDALVQGQSQGMALRYYTYNQAIYKLWEEKKIMLAFYSHDNYCWSLFEEYALDKGLF